MASWLLLVHSPLVGSATWDLVAADMAGGGWEVAVPDLTGTVTAGRPYCLRQAEVIARSASGQPAILIGPSGAGPLPAPAGAPLNYPPGSGLSPACPSSPGVIAIETGAAGLAPPSPER